MTLLTHPSTLQRVHILQQSRAPLPYLMAWTYALNHLHARRIHYPFTIYACPTVIHEEEIDGSPSYLLPVIDVPIIDANLEDLWPGTRRRYGSGACGRGAVNRSPCETYSRQVLGERLPNQSCSSCQYVTAQLASFKGQTLRSSLDG
jgi:hypothetical protein